MIRAMLSLSQFEYLLKLADFFGEKNFKLPYGSQKIWTWIIETKFDLPNKIKKSFAFEKLPCHQKVEKQGWQHP